MRTILITAILSFLVVGCMSKAMYQKPGADEETFQRDAAECRVRMNQTPSNPGMDSFGNAAIALQVRDDCMRAKGYVRVQ